MGGAVARVPADATAFGDRSAPFLLNTIAQHVHRRRLRRGRAVGAAICTRRCAPSLTGGTYVNFLTDEGEDGVRAAYGADKFDRLVALKDEYDPCNLFRLNQNIRPSRER